MSVNGRIVFCPDCNHEREQGSQVISIAPADGWFAELQIGNGVELAPVLIALWSVEQQIFDGANFQPFQLRCAFWPDTPQGGHWLGKSRGLLVWRRHRHRGDDTNRCASLQRQTAAYFCVLQKLKYLLHDLQHSPFHLRNLSPHR